jgi:hypothetical protein
MFAHYFSRLCDYFLAFYVTKHGHTWAIGMLLVLMRIGPSCPRAHSRWLCRSLLWTGLFIDAFTFFPLFGFAALFWGAWLGIFYFAHTYTLLSNYDMHSWIGSINTVCMYFNHIDFFYWQGRIDLLLLNPCVKNREDPGCFRPRDIQGGTSLALTWNS